MKRKVGIIGCGWLGYRIAKYLSDSFEVHTTVTTETKIELLSSEGFHPEIINFDRLPGEDDISPWQKLLSIDHIIITVPLFSKRVSQDVLDIRIRNVSAFLARYRGPITLMSSIGVYKEVTGEITEELLPAESCSGEKEIRQLFKQANILRLGGLMGDDRLLSKYKVSEMDAAVNHIHFYDICRIVHLLITQSATATVYNVVAPLHPSKRQVIESQTGVSSGPSAATATGKIIVSQKMVKELEYQFIYPDPRQFHIPNNPGAR
ncbi:hypothetical protein ACTJIJ_19025 [Niabella sp. 22666]|uniref:hypothetical protein n=1 Tax=Niabella sp. 22666 TaxID=3453954 RepID=UPI003F839F2D